MSAPFARRETVRLATNTEEEGDGGFFYRFKIIGGKVIGLFKIFYRTKPDGTKEEIQEVKVEKK